MVVNFRMRDLQTLKEFGAKNLASQTVILTVCGYLRFS